MTITRIAVLGGGTMGAGIAQAALAAALPVLLYDVDEAALERAAARIAEGLRKRGQRDRAGALTAVTTLEGIAGADLVIEAAPEQLDLKQDLLARAAATCPAPAILASNTSSLPIAALAAACPAPERVAGLHFFNPVHRMALVEVVRAAQTDEATVAVLLAFAERLGKTPVLARDTPGFIVNRVARPFYGEALRLLGERAAAPETIDAALRQAGGFPLGPFALMDLIGVDVNFAVTRSMYEQGFGEPRWRPHPIQQQMVLAGRLGRKTGRGFYAYDARRPTTDDRDVGAKREPPSSLDRPPSVAHRPSSVLIGSGSWAPGLEELCRAAGLRLLEELPYGPGDLAAALIPAARSEGAIEQVLILDRNLPPETPILVQCGDITAAELASAMARPERLVGFDGLFTDGVMTLAETPVLGEMARAAAEALVRALGREPAWCADTPALLVPRVVAALANEAAFALGEGVADAATIDTAMRLGANYPAGPLERAAALGYDKVVAILDHLRDEYGEERYRVAPALRRAARIGRL